jgi:hypothetical protein
MVSRVEGLPPSDLRFKIMKNDTFKLVSKSKLLTADEALAQMAIIDGVNDGIDAMLSTHKERQDRADAAQKQAVDFADMLGLRLIAHCDGSEPLQPIAHRVITERYNAAHIAAMQAIADYAAITGPQS